MKLRTLIWNTSIPDKPGLDSGLEVKLLRPIPTFFATLLIATLGVQAQSVTEIDPERARLENERNTMEIVSEHGSGVVYIQTQIAARETAEALPPELRPFAQFFGPFIQPPQEGAGSGFVIDEDGYILTNYHVVQSADEITVRFQGDSASYPAEVIGTAQPLDLALIQVKAPDKKLNPLPLGDSDLVQVGQKAIAIGNPFQFDFSVTEGIVSAVRPNPGAIEDLVPRLIQTDAAINPGNSGGPLLNSRGEVVGINTAIVSRGAPQFAGVGFAIPINLAKEVLPRLQDGDELSEEDVLATRPTLGVAVIPAEAIPPQARERYQIPDSGLVIQEVTPGSPAERARLRAPENFIYLSQPGGRDIEIGVDGDVITGIDGQPVVNITDLRTVLYNLGPGDTVELTVERNGRSRTVTVEPQVQDR